jgi:thiamine-monophosphate kinase
MSAACLRMDRPTARLELGMALRGIATAAADISDGLLGDLGHILERSGVGATIYTEVAPGLMHNAQAAQAAGQDVLACVLAGGDDYELVFTAAPEQRAAVEAASKNSNTIVTRIGHIEAPTDTHTGLRLLAADGSVLTNRYTSFDHFST